MNDEQKVLCAQLETADTNLVFLSFVVLGVLLSFVATARQRDSLCLTIQGDTEKAARVGDVTRFRLATSALIVGSLGFFFQQALETANNADPCDPVAQRTARLDVIAGFLVLLAALIRLFALNMARRSQPSLAQTLPPD